MASKKRCVNIDWLEVYCKESNANFPCNAQFFRDRLITVRERDYGTRQYREMFVILDKDNEPFIEIRRNPVSSSVSSAQFGIYDPLSCHIRLSNRYCYADNAVDLLAEFLQTYDYTVCRLYRLDICLDFERFDKGDDPQEVVKRYMKGRYTKIYQGHISAHGADRWNIRDWSSLSWGSPTSMVGTKLYNKTKELEEAKDKPYIRYAWWAAGLVDDWRDLTKKAEDGTIYKPTIWRVEFSIRSEARGWYSYEDCNGKKTKKMRREHTLSTYASKADQLKAFAFLAHHYFHFKKYEEGVRKDLCEDKVLFDFGEHEVYKIDRLLTSTPKDATLQNLQKRLRLFKMQHPDRDVANACTALLKFIGTLQVRNALPYAPSNEAKLLQLLIERRMKYGKDEDMSSSLRQVETMLTLSDLLF